MIVTALPGLCPTGLAEDWEVALDEATIAERVCQLGDEVSEDYRGCQPTLVCIMKGAFVFSSDLLRTLTIPAELDFLSVARYRRSPAQREVRVTADVAGPVEGRDILIIEDVIDTGLSLHFLLAHFQEKCPNSLAVCTLLDRPSLRLADVEVRYVGFNVSNSFLVGYGLDFRDQYRNLPFIVACGERSGPATRRCFAGRDI